MSQKPRRRTDSPPTGGAPTHRPAERPRVRVAVSEGEINDGGVSIEDLGQAFAAMMGHKADPYASPPADAALPDQPPAVPRPEPVDATGEPATGGHDEACDVSPRSILEAMLFVGHPANEPLTAVEVAGLMRGVLPEEIDELVRELNEEYAADGAPYTIASVGAGYQMQLREEFAPLHDKLLGRVREAKLSQAAIDILAVVAYQQPITRAELDKTRGKPAGGLLAQLVRRDLLRIERPADKPREPLYYTTDRFLALFGLDSLDDLPRSHDLERNL
jgi:segregation and condensation protein B